MIFNFFFSLSSIAILQKIKANQCIFVPQDFDNRELENEEENKDLCEALEKSLEEIDESSTVPVLESDYASTEFDHLGLENVEENNDLCEALEKSLKEIEESTVLIAKRLCSLLFSFLFCFFLLSSLAILQKIKGKSICSRSTGL